MDHVTLLGHNTSVSSEIRSKFSDFGMLWQLVQPLEQILFLLVQLDVYGKMSHFYRNNIQCYLYHLCAYFEYTRLLLYHLGHIYGFWVVLTAISGKDRLFRSVDMLNACSESFAKHKGWPKGSFKTSSSRTQKQCYIHGIKTKSSDIQPLG